MSIINLFKIDLIYSFAIIIAFLFAIDIILFLLIRKSNDLKKIIFLHFIIAFVIYLTVIWAFFINSWNRDFYNYQTFYFIIKHFFAFYLFKISFILLSIPFLIVKLKNYYKFTFTISFIVYLIIIYGLYFGRFKFITTETNLILNGSTKYNRIKIVQISDLHLGSFVGDIDKVRKIVDIVNQQNADIVVFTGDLINCYAEETYPFENILNKIKSKHGNYAVYGNHDYSDYYKWKNIEDQKKNHLILDSFYRKINFKVLNNENVRINYNNKSFVIAGIENFGTRFFARKGNIKKAIQNTKNDDLVILLSHDPLFWDYVFVKYPQIKLTLSGHTHAYQMGIRFNNNYYWTAFANSYSKIKWKGLYKRNNQYLYITNGLGSSFFPARITMWPEISVINIKF